MAEFDKVGAVGSMWLHRSLGTKLISENIALQLARLVTAERYGQIEVDRNEPLHATSDGDAWLVRGSQSEDFNAEHPPRPDWHGPLRMRISQFDAQILDYAFGMRQSK